MTRSSQAAVHTGLPEHASGDVAACGYFADSRATVEQLPRERLCFLSPLASRSEIESLLRRLLLNADIRHLVLCGEGTEPTGDALIALWKAGLDSEGRLAGPRGLLSEELDAAAIDMLRESVQIHDWRGRQDAEVAQGILELPVLPAVRESRTLHTPPPRERPIFPSRGTTFPIFSSCAGDAWLQLLNLALRIGMDRQTADGARYAEASNTVVTIEPEADTAELPPFFDFVADDLERHLLRLESAHSEVLDALCTQMQKTPATGADVTSLFDPDDPLHAAFVPGLVSAAFEMMNGRLCASLAFRSMDLYTAWPLQAATLLHLQRRAAARLGLAVGPSVFFMQSARLLDTDWGRSWRLLGEFFKRPLPLKIDPAGIFLFGNDGGQARAMLLDHDASTIFWEGAFSDPEDLSWYIIDVMPWLLPQHIRYVGQECAALMRAIKTGECYVQG